MVRGAFVVRYWLITQSLLERIEAEDEATADEQLANYIDMMLASSKVLVPLDLADLDEIGFMLNEAEEVPG